MGRRVAESRKGIIAVDIDLLLLIQNACMKRIGTEVM